MKKVIALAGVTALLAPSALAVNSVDAQPSFAGTVWYSSPAAVKKQLESRGYVATGSRQQAGAKDLTFIGKVNGVGAFIQAWFNEKEQLVGTSVIFNSDKYSNKSLSVYRDFEKQLNEKYGVPRKIDTLKKYSDYLDVNDIEAEKTEITSIWNFSTSGFAIVLYVGMPFPNDTQAHAVIEYLSPLNKAEMERRAKNGDL